MPILENIKVAEEKAEEIRQKARTEVETMLEDAKISGEEKAKKALATANNTINSNNQETINLIEKLEIETKENIEKEKKVLEGLAKKNEEIALNYVLKQVVDL